MDFNHLRTFIAIAEEGNLTKAAKRLFMTPPAVSIQIKLLEEELGVELFIRTARGMSLTEKGKRLKEKAALTLQSAQDMVNLATDIKDHMMGTLRIGLNTNPEYLKIGEITQNMSELSHGVDLHLIESDSGRIIESLLNNELDLGFCYGKIDTEKFESIQLQEVELVLAYPKQWEDKLDDVTDFSKWTWISSEVYCPFEVYNQSIRVGEQDDSKVKKVNTNFEVTKLSLIKSGIGAAYVEKSVFEDDRSDKIACIEDKNCTIENSLMYLKERSNDPLIKLYVDQVEVVWNL